MNNYSLIGGPCKKIAPFFKKMAKEHPKIKFVKVDSDKATEIKLKEEIRYVPTFVYYLKEKKILKSERADRELLESRVKELDPDTVFEGEKFKSKNHDHELIKFKRYNVICNLCHDDFEMEPVELFFCRECNYNICQNCKLKEEGKEPIPTNYTMERITNEKDFNDILSKNEKVLGYFYEGEEPPIPLKALKLFVDEYKMIKFIRVTSNEETKELFKKYEVKNILLISFEKGEKKEGFRPRNHYETNKKLFLLSGIKGETYKCSKHEHELVKMNHTVFLCSICSKIPENKGFIPVFRCNECDFDLCLECYEKDKKGELKEEK